MVHVSSFVSGIPGGDTELCRVHNVETRYEWSYGRSTRHKPELGIVSQRQNFQLEGRARLEQADREREQDTHDGRHERSLVTEDGTIDISEADSLMQIVGKINRDADYEYSGRATVREPRGSG
jgi:hypothetical protein